jgi:hypothetical protein
MSKLLLKKSSISGKVPLNADLDYGELALNYADNKLYFKDSSNAITSIGSGGLFETIVYNTTTTNTNQIIDSFDITEYSSVKFLIQVKSGTDIHCTEVFLMHNGTNVFLSEYATMYSTVSLGILDADILTGTCRILFSPTNAINNITIKRIGS